MSSPAPRNNSTGNAGGMLPEYTSWIDESMSWKDGCYLGDWSFLLKVRIWGPDALKLLTHLSVNSMAKFEIGRAKHCIMCSEAGKVICEGVLMRLGEEEFVFQAGATAYWLSFMARKLGWQVETELLGWFNLSVQGPTALPLIEGLADESLRDIGFMRFRTISVVGVEAYALRQGMAGEVGFELQGPIERHADVYGAIMAAGTGYGLRQLGGRAFAINHLEACFPTTTVDYKPAIFGPDFADFRAELERVSPGYLAARTKRAGSFTGPDMSAWYRSPIELGWRKNIKFDHDFIGRDALEKEMADPQRTMVTLVWDRADVVNIFDSLFEEGATPYAFMDIPRGDNHTMWADRVFSSGVEIGATTSRGYSYYFRKMLSLCTIDVAFAEPGTRIEILWGDESQPQKRVGATVAPAPYKQDNRRADLTKLPDPAVVPS